MNRVLLVNNHYWHLLLWQASSPTLSGWWVPAHLTKRWGKVQQAPVQGRN